jgi:hypothetical protein
VKEAPTPVDRSVHIVGTSRGLRRRWGREGEHEWLPSGLSNLLNGISFGTAVSMTTISLNAKFGFDSLQARGCVPWTVPGSALTV